MTATVEVRRAARGAVDLRVTIDAQSMREFKRLAAPAAYREIKAALGGDFDSNASLVMAAATVLSLLEQGSLR